MNQLGIILFAVGFVIFVPSVLYASIDARRTGKLLSNNKTVVVTLIVASWLVAIAGLILVFASS